MGANAPQVPLPGKRVTLGDRLNARMGQLRVWITKNPTAALTITGVVLYVVLRFSAAVFYDPLGFTPEEVGLSYATTLAVSLYGLGLFVLWRIAVAYLFPIVGGTIAHLFGRLARNDSPRLRDRVRKGLPEKGWFTSEIVLNWIPITLLFFMVGISFFTGRDAAAGNPVSYHPLGFTWRAEAARIYPDKGVDSPLPSGACVLFLGEADGLYALYDPAGHRAIRIAVSDVSLVTGGDLRQVERVPDDCP